MNDTETVEVWSVDPSRKIDTGELAVAEDGLPYVRIKDKDIGFRPWTFPNNWTLQTTRTFPGPLLDAWRGVLTIMADLREWEQRHELAGREEQGEEG